MKKIILSLMLLCALCACSSSDDTESKDMTYPEISDQGIVAVPIDCQVFKRGEVIPFNYLFTDDTELGAYNIEIHHNFDHHTHSTSSVECLKLSLYHFRVLPPSTIQLRNSRLKQPLPG